MVGEVRKKFAGAIEESGKTFTTDAFFLALMLVQQGMIRELRTRLEAFEPEGPQVGRMISLDRWVRG